jgi:ribonuclease-3
MYSLEQLVCDISLIEARIGYVFKDKWLLALAFVHCSYTNEHRDIREHNERLEFLGDAVLGMLVAEYLYVNFPTIPEGELSHLRARLVEAHSCVLYIQKLDVESFLLLGKGEKMNDGRGRESIMADLFEALIGAIYLDGGIEPIRRLLFVTLIDLINITLKTPTPNWKALLQDFCQKKFQKVPIYTVLDEKGPEHSKQFTVVVSLGSQKLGSGIGSSKKTAQQAAAEDAMSRCG